MSGDAHDRTTSHAKTVDLNYEKSALDRALALKEQFNITKAAQQALEQEKIRQAENASRTSHAPKPEQHLRPEGLIRREKDREIDMELQRKEAQRSDAVNNARAFKHRAKQQKIPDMDRSR
jgi:hypothetical protein